MSAMNPVKAATAATPAVPAKRARAARIRQRPDDEYVDPRELARRRKNNREYMRTWRASPENRETERRRLAGQYLRRRLERRIEALHGHEDRRCAYCHQEAVMVIDRLRATAHGFKRVELPYCGHC